MGHTDALRTGLLLACFSALLLCFPVEPSEALHMQPLRFSSSVSSARLLSCGEGGEKTPYVTAVAAVGVPAAGGRSKAHLLSPEIGWRSDPLSTGHSSLWRSECLERWKADGGRERGSELCVFASGDGHDLTDTDDAATARERIEERETHEETHKRQEKRKEEEESSEDQKKQDARRKRLKAWQVVLHNDEIHAIRHVTELLVAAVPSLTKAKAHAITVHAHKTGLALILRTWREKAKEIQQKLKSSGLTISLVPSKKKEDGGAGDDDGGGGNDGGDDGGGDDRGGDDGGGDDGGGDDGGGDDGGGDDEDVGGSDSDRDHE
ncbi:ATP-dependent Clp protease adaptor protein ClpS protein [Besnoitia besnoiti]|uniref:ATP-dependent Clp protease adaptor protein ClpS protein n=1 Tax=Besnoitia besnoiti TaxID=94643 RepID=A0A2A9M8G6_BESBE|nr:ATP-dependent Clp protease adaptor protein ClpS protein [Besnoitia besnoiti]PFH31680.1 ATP-dependent Clp protease adaptor protein ClpS protein [Besnoitia besnoiti]